MNNIIKVIMGIEPFIGHLLTYLNFHLLNLCYILEGHHDTGDAAVNDNRMNGGIDGVVFPAYQLIGKLCAGVYDSGNRF